VGCSSAHFRSVRGADLLGEDDGAGWVAEMELSAVSAMLFPRVMSRGNVGLA
jgi:hypothetical protein